MDVKIFAKKLKEKRLQKGFTQEALAKRLFVTKKAVSRWETGRGLPDAALLPELASALDITIDELFNAEETEILDYYREFHQRVDEHTLYVQSYERQRSYLNFFKILVGALICVIVALAIVASNYHKAYTQGLLTKEYTLMWRDYSKENSTWQKQTFSTQALKENFSYRIKGEVGSCIVLAFGGATYDADGEPVFKESYTGWRTLYQDGEKDLYYSEYTPCEYILDYKSELNQAFANASNVIFCSSWGAHQIEYGKSGYRGPTFFVNVSIPEDDREIIELSYTTTIGERVDIYGFSGSELREVIKEKTVEAFGRVAFGLWEEGLGWTDLISVNPQPPNKEEIENLKAWSEGGRLNVMYLSTYGGWVYGMPKITGHVYRVRIEFIGSTKYRSCALDFDLYIELSK